MILKKYNRTFYSCIFNYVVSGNTVVVEGTESGTMIDEQLFPDQEISFDKFCSVFEFSDNRIKRMHIYVDPDFACEDTIRIARFRQ